MKKYSSKQMKLARWAIANAILLACTAQTSIAAKMSTSEIQNSETAQHADTYEIKNVSLRAASSGSDELHIELSKAPITLPKNFVLLNPSRIILDFENTQSLTGRIKQMVNSRNSNILSYSVIPAGKQVRVVIDLKKGAVYDVSSERNEIVVRIGTEHTAITTATSVAGNAITPMQEASAVYSSPATTTTVEALKDIDFRRSTDGTGRIIVSLPSANVGVNIQQKDGNLVVELSKTSLPQGLSRKMDVTDFGTLVDLISLQQIGDKVRMTIAAKGNWEHSAYQSDKNFVLEIKEKKTASKSDGNTYAGQKISLNFQNIEVRSLLQVIADFTQFNVVTSDSVAGSVTLRLQDVPWDQALDIVLQAKGLGMRKSGNVMWIAPKEEIAAKEKIDLEAASTVQNLEPLRTQSFQINYAKAADIAAQISPTGSSIAANSITNSGSVLGSRFLTARGSAFAEPRTNQLFVTDIPSKLEEIRKLIDKLDIAVKQVLIEARIVEASDTFSRSLGVRLGAVDFSKGSRVGNGNSIGFGTNYSSLGPTTGQTEPSIKMNFNDNNVNLPATKINGSDPGTLAFSIFNAAANQFLNLEISALEADGKGKIVSSPRVVTADQTKAIIEQGTELPYLVASSSGATAVSFRKANLKLEVTPQITPEGKVILDLDVTKDVPGMPTVAGFAVNTKHVKTQVLVDNGGTVVIGGIFEEVVNNQVTKVPLLGDIPFLGALFRRTDKMSNKQEMLIFITPKVIRDKIDYRE